MRWRWRLGLGGGGGGLGGGGGGDGAGELDAARAAATRRAHYEASTCAWWTVVVVSVSALNGFGADIAEQRRVPSTPPERVTHVDSERSSTPPCTEFSAFAAPLQRVFQIGRKRTMSSAYSLCAPRKVTLVGVGAGRHRSRR